ncbi:hypothetical protein MHYP_G00048100 [Metynnis hypsauchen]
MTWRNTQRCFSVCRPLTSIPSEFFHVSVFCGLSPGKRAELTVSADRPGAAARLLTCLVVNYGSCGLTPRLPVLVPQFDKCLFDRLSLRPPEAHPQSLRYDLQRSTELLPGKKPTHSGGQQSAAHRGSNHRHVELQSFIKIRSIRHTRSAVRRLTSDKRPQQRLQSGVSKESGVLPSCGHEEKYNMFFPLCSTV